MEYLDSFLSVETPAGPADHSALHHLSDAVRYTAEAGALMMPLAVGAVAAAEIPARVAVAPGVTGYTRLEFGSGATLNTGATGSLYFANGGAEVPGVGMVSGSLRLDPITVPQTSQHESGLSNYAALLSNPTSSVIAPAGEAIQKHALEGLGAGLLLSMSVAAALTSRSHNRRRKHEQARAQFQTLERQDAELSKLPSVTPEIHHNQEVAKLRAKQQIEDYSPRRQRLAHALLAIAVLGSGSAALGKLTSPDNQKRAAAACVPLSSEITDIIPPLKDARACGMGLQYGLSTIAGYKQATDTMYNRSIVPNLHTLLDKIPQSDLWYLHDPAYTAAAVVSDYHCNILSIEDVLPLVTHKFAVSTIINSGDTGMSKDTFLLDNLCSDSFRAALTPTKAFPQEVTMVIVPGNHDSNSVMRRLSNMTVENTDGKKYHPVVVLDGKNKYQLTVNGLTFVGAADPRSSVIGQTLQPEDPTKQTKLMVAEGKLLATDACMTLKNSGHSPIEIAHDHVATDATIVAGCATSTFTGHLHEEHLPVTFLDKDGHKTTAFIQGTSAGNGEEVITEYAPPKKDAPIAIFIFKKNTNQPVGYYEVITHPDGSSTYHSFQAFDQTEPVSQDVYNFLSANDGAISASTVLPTPLPSATHQQTSTSATTQYHHPHTVLPHTAQPTAQALRLEHLRVK